MDNTDTDIEELPFKIVTVTELNEEYFAKLFSYWKEQVYIDGLVIYLNDLSLWQAIGRQQTTSFSWFISVNQPCDGISGGFIRKTFWR